MENLKLKFKVVALATKYKNCLDFSYINNAIKEYCSFNSHVKTLSNIGLLDDVLSTFKSKVLSYVGLGWEDILFHIGGNDFYVNYLQPFCQLLGLNFSVVLKVLENYLDSMNDFIIECDNLGCNRSYSIKCCELYLNYIEIPKKFMKEYLEYASKYN